MPSRIRRVNSTLAPPWHELQIKTGLRPIEVALLMEEADSSACRVFDVARIDGAVLAPYPSSSPSSSLSLSLFAYMRALAALDPLQQLQCGLKLFG